jgi:hypothetical protein
MQFHHILDDEGNMNIYCCDPNDINIVTFNDIKIICDENNHPLGWSYFVKMEDEDNAYEILWIGVNP